MKIKYQNLCTFERFKNFIEQMMLSTYYIVKKNYFLKSKNKVNLMLDKRKEC